MFNKLHLLGIFALSLAAFAQTELIRDFKNDLSKLPQEKLSTEVFDQTSPSMKLDSTGIKSGQFVGHAFYVFKEAAQALRGKTIEFRVKTKHVAGNAALGGTFRVSTSPGNELRVTRSFSLNIPVGDQFQEQSATFTVPNLDNIAHVNVQLGFRQQGEEHNLWFIDEPQFRYAENSDSVQLPTDILGLSALIDKEPLVLVEDGKAKFSIVIAAAADPIAKLAAEELQLHCQLALGADIPMRQESENQAIGGPAIHVGGTTLVQKFALQPANLPPESWIIARTGENIILTGGDTPGANRNQALSTRGVATGTLYAAYEFLERIFGVRWYWPGNYGTVVPPATDIKITRLLQTGTPSYSTRGFLYSIPRDKEISTEDFIRWYRRNRIGSANGSSMANHSFNAWPKKFGATHPEYFALQVDGRRKTDEVAGGHVCLSNPEVLKETIREKLEYFEKNPDAGFSSVMPGDSFGLYKCICEDCQKPLQPERGPGGIASNLVWDFVNKVALGVAEKMPDRYITCCAYGEYRQRPDFPLAPNVAVTLCYSAQPRSDQISKNKWRAMLDEWRQTGAALYIWEYWNNSRYSRGVYGAPAVFPRHLQEFMRLDQGQVRGRALELSNIDGDGVSFPYWTDWIYDVLNIYVVSHLMNNINCDVEKLLDEYYPNFYGPAAEPMRQFHDELELAWTKGNYSDGWNWETCWVKTYPPEFVDRMMGLLRQSVQLCAGQEPYLKRAQKTLEGYLPFERNSFLFREKKSQTNVPEITVPQGTVKPQLDGRPDEEAWQKAAVISNFCDSYNIYEQKAITEMRFLVAEETLFVAISAKIPPERTEINWADDLGERDSLLWNRESAELFFVGQDKECYQFIVAPNGKIADFKWPAENMAAALKWDAQGLQFAVLRENNTTWTAEIAIPLSNLTFAKPPQDCDFIVNFARNHRFQDAQDKAWKWEQSCWLPTYGPFHSYDKFGKMRLSK
ncbi:MAG: DUF4838 domain-containing protein [Lentisphaerae bacterium]|nr:DUF4838 domain-containing protein [Lentisphaerota bacterium]